MELSNANYATWSEQQSMTFTQRNKSEEETAFTTPAACSVSIDDTTAYDYQALSQNTIDPDTQYATPYIRQN